MSPISVAYLGPPASYTHQAAADTFPAPTTTLIPHATIPAIFAAIQHGTADRGVVPFENSTYGPVLTTLDLFASCLSSVPPPLKPVGGAADAKTGAAQSHHDVEVCGEAFVQVRHCLLGRRRRQRGSSSISDQQGQSNPPADATEPAPPPPPPTSLSHIRQVLSHEQALGQCKSLLSASLAHAERKEVSSTSKAAELAAADETGETAALSSAMAAGVYGLEVLREGVQDRSDNVTRFMVLRRRTGEEEEVEKEVVLNGSARAATTGVETSSMPHSKALVLFTVDHTSAGALAEALAVFKRHELNLTSINTRPSGVAPWNYFFYVEVEGREGYDERLRGSLEELGALTKSARCLGSWLVV